MNKEIRTALKGGLVNTDNAAAASTPKTGDKRKQSTSESDGFDYTGTAKKLRRQLNEFKKLNYDNMKSSLYAKDVITTEEQDIIDSKISHEKMEYLIVKIIIPSLELGHGKKYKYFLETMEESEDTDLQDTARKLGGSERVPADTTQTELSPKTRDKRKRSTSESDGIANEKVLSKTDGTNYVDEGVREKIKEAVCIVNTPNGTGTGFIGRIAFHKEDSKKSVVLVTNYHVIITEKSKKVSKTTILGNARKSTIKMGAKNINLSGIIVERSYKMSSVSSLDYFIIKLDEAKLSKVLPKGIPTIDLNHRPKDIENNDQITIFQHPHKGPISSSSSTCKIVEPCEGDRARLMVYRCGTDPGSSGGPILKIVNEDLVIVGLHRGGYEDNWDKKGAIGYNFGTLFSDIIKSIQQDWHPKGSHMCS